MNTIDPAAIDQLFLKARSHNGWTSQPVDDATLHEIWNLLRWAPTSANCCPLRVVFVKGAAAKAKLLSCLAPGNVEKTKAAPVTAILAMDTEFHEQLPKLFPHADARSWFAGNQPLIDESAFRNSSLQCAYFMMAARALGLDCGPMSGFDKAAVDREFLAGTTWRSNMLCNLGHGDTTALFPRSPRFEFADACRIA